MQVGELLDLHQVINCSAGEHVDPMQVGELLDLHQQISFPVFSHFISRLLSSDLRRKSILYCCIIILKVKKRYS